MEKGMKNLKFRRFLSITLSAIMCFGVTSCGKNETVVDDYAAGSNTAASTESTGTEGDAKEIKQGTEGSLRDLFGKSVSWEEEFTIDGVRFTADVDTSIPDKEGMNVYYAEGIDDGKADEDAIVKNLFGDTAEKIEELKYTNETDYIPLLYKYRELIDEHERFEVNQDSETYTYIEPSYSIINGATGETYKWVDDKNYYIHMYEGEYDGKRFGLILAFDYISNKRTIFMEPISIKEYFPDKDYKTLLVTSDSNYVGEPLDMENACGMNVDEINEEAEDFIDKTLKLKGKLTINKDSSLYSALSFNYLVYAGSVSYYYMDSDMSFDKGSSVLMFSDADYISTLKSHEEHGDNVAYSILADQKDLYKEYTDAHPDKNTEIFEFVMSDSTSYKENVVDPNFDTDGYAVFVGSDVFTGNDIYNGVSVYSPNTGIIKYTSKGFYGMDLTLTEVIKDVKEDVQLLPFEKITESLQAELPERFDKNKMELNSKGVYLDILNLTYTPDSDDPTSNEFSYIPCWTFDMYPDGNGSNGAEVIVNAMDGSIVDLYYWSTE
ncbi:hypothetical protein SAMN02910369_00044 [Lachnospiraceae bacterium NE2001]|nr:hypothetical protein SAMN02910369_00044 [Lachnospiraceae bacterium NE2001]